MTTIVLDITTCEGYYRPYYCKCLYLRYTDGEAAAEFEMTQENALQMMWELVKLGGTKTVTPNRFCRTITTRKVILHLDT